MNESVDLKLLTPTDRMTGEDDAETKQLRDMLLRAEKYVTSFVWSPPISDRFIGIGIGGVFALFLFKFERAVNGADHWLWVVEGDVPSAYFVVDEAPNPAAAIDVYCHLMDEWVKAVRDNQSLDTVFPVGASPTVENADALETRMQFIRDRILPTLPS